MSEVQIGISITSEDAGARKARRRLEQIETAQQNLSRAFERGTINADQFNKSFTRLEKSGRKLNRALDQLERPRQIDVNNDNFNQLSRDVGLAGDAQSNLGAASALTDAAGLGALSQGLSIGGEGFALIEELPRLKASFQGLPGVVSTSAGALGTNSAGLIGSLGALGIAAAAVGVAVQIAAQQIAKAGEGFSRVIDAQIEAERLIATGGTVEQAQERITALQAEAEALRTVNENTRAATPALIEFAAKIPILNRLPAIGKFREEFDELAAGIDGAEKEAAAYQQAIDAGRLVTESATDKEQAAASAGQQTQQAEEALARSRQQSVSSAQQAAQAERSLFDERAQAAQRGNRFATPGVLDADTAVAGALQGTVIGRSSRLARGGSGGDDRAQAAQEQGNRLADIERETGQRRADIARQTQDRLADAAQQADDAIEDIRRRGDREESDAVRRRNFAALADAQRQEGRAIEDEQLPVGPAQPGYSDGATAPDARPSDANAAATARSGRRAGADLPRQLGRHPSVGSKLHPNGTAGA